MPRRVRQIPPHRSSYLSVSLTFFFCGLALLWPLSSPTYSHSAPPPPPIVSAPIRIDSRLLSPPLTVSANPPLRLIIPKLSLDLKITESPVVNGYWQLSETTASHGIGSANPGQSGNIVIFAHARPGLFLPLRQADTDMIVYLLTSRGWHQYQIRTITTVSPYRIASIGPTSAETLTLFTCTGFADSQRLVVQAYPLVN